MGLLLLLLHHRMGEMRRIALLVLGRSDSGGRLLLLVSFDMAIVQVLSNKRPPTVSHLALVDFLWLVVQCVPVQMFSPRIRLVASWVFAREAERQTFPTCPLPLLSLLALHFSWDFHRPGSWVRPSMTMGGDAWGLVSWGRVAKEGGKAIEAGVLWGWF